MGQISPFSLGTPSLFLISTPFQALCALATIRQLKIVDYKIIAHLPKNEIRNAQVTNFLEENHLMYYKYTPGFFSEKFYRRYCKIKKQTKYKRMFVGNHNDVPGFCRVCSCVSDNAYIVYLDDGVQSISLFKGVLIERKTQEGIDLINEISYKRKLKPLKYFLSIYDGIANSKYIIEKLDMSFVLKTGIRKNDKEKVIIIGSVLSEIAQIYNIELNVLEGKLEELFILLKKEYPDNDIVYIPHGRDKSDYAFRLCEKYNCVFKKCDSMVEIELLKASFSLKAIYGYTSSALFSLKAMFPYAKVVNIIFKSDAPSSKIVERLSISDYYKDHGIEMVVQ